MVLSLALKVEPLSFVPHGSARCGRLPHDGAFNGCEGRVYERGTINGFERDAADSGPKIRALC